ncbi:YdcF family protein [Vibrio sp. Isolate31]|uniref:YdcF family protein n=1 Tax=unclassified Vibrio TaxID=2614977 RepID=UPI001EFD8200|nr:MULTISPECIES: YdcF family protein [unclassified Vibrio]MCG9554546.1 YdcF family protein [Vibrio sp. Isolate32]MCG9602146.1 YdcF family protein [Vibrio sp. Isolate31]
MSINHLLIVLGKRLNENKLTDEGISRVDALVEYLAEPLVEESNQQTAVAFCGGVTKGQTLSEADAMHQYFRKLENQREHPFSLGAILLEQHSTNTVENIQNLASEMIASGLFTRGQSVQVTFVSNDYHLQRIFEIQSLMDEQGLLKVLVEKCSALGVDLQIECQLEDHVAAPYPHQSAQGRLFLLMDVVTTYRVYLEGVCAGVFRDLELVRREPERLSLEALITAKELVGRSSNFEIVDSLLPVLESCIQKTSVGTDIKKIRGYLALLDTNLTLLNRCLDPESDHTHRWWR